MERFQIINEDNRMFPMGITVTGTRIHIRAVAEGESCKLALFLPGQTEPCEMIPFPPEGRMGSVWSMTLEGQDFSGLEYCYEIDGSFASDPYGRAFTGRGQWGSLESAGTLMKSPLITEPFDWGEDKAPCIPYEEMIIYRLHVRGFTRHASSKVMEKGTFNGVVEKIPYLKELGINAIELLPVVEFNEIVMPGGIDGNPYGHDVPTGKLNYWGYAPCCYFAPKASYGVQRGSSPEHELKTMVKKLHEAGIEVIAELYFAGDEPPSFVLDVIRFWIMEYHMDGIHLVGHAPERLIGADPYLSRTKLFSTSWDGTSRGAVKHLAEYHDGFLVDMRRVLKGDEDQMNQLIFRTKRNPKGLGVINYISHTNGFTLMDMVSYDMKHNEANGENNLDGTSYNYSWNCGVEGLTRKKKILDLRKKQIRNAVLLLFLSQGTPLLLAGDEFGNSKGGNNNSYCQDNEISWLNWNLLKTNKDIYRFVKYVIAFRKAHPVFHMKTEPMVMDYLSCGHPDVSYHGVKAWCPEFENFRRQLGIMYCGKYGRYPDGSSDNYFFVAYNMHWEPHEFALPNLPKKMRWHEAINTDAKEVNGIFESGNERLLEDQKQFTVPARTIVVFMGK